MEVIKLNESYSIIDDKPEKLQEIFNFLRVLRPGAYFDPMVKSGFKSPYEYYASIQNKKLLVMNGHLSLLGHFGVIPEELKSEYTQDDLDKFLSQVKSTLPFAPHDFQERAFKESILNVKQINKMCTGSGKSMTISLIAEFFRRQGKKGLLLVPNINLLTQFKNDIKDYNLHELHNDTHTIGGGSTERHFNNSLTISTWQSMMTAKSSLDELDYVITDEAHRFASEETGGIVKSTVNCRYKWGFTGTLPEDPTMKMELFGLFGLPKTYITSRELIDRGLATPIKINSVLFKYNDQDKKLFRATGNYAKQLQFIKDHEARNSFVVNLSCKLRNSGNTLVLFSHTSHGKLLFMEVMRKLCPGVEVQNKDITGKNSFGFQEKYGVYFLNGEDDAKTRELTRKILEEHDSARLTLEDGSELVLHKNTNVKLVDGSHKHQKDLTVQDEIDGDWLKEYTSSQRTTSTTSTTSTKIKEINRPGSILISNYQILSTGVNIKKLHNMVLSSPLKSYTTVTQSIGRGMRLHETKEVFTVFDLVDDFGFRAPSGIFYKQYQHRKQTSYNVEEFPVHERQFALY